MLVIKVIEHITEILPLNIKEAIENCGRSLDITEIRLRIGTNLRLRLGRIEKELDINITKEDLLRILNNVSYNSIYSVQKDINNGFLTIKGGNRIGIAGEVVIVDNKIKSVKGISSMNIRVSKEFIGAANNIMDSIVVDGRIKNTLIVSSPGVGKTTLLRDIVRNLSEIGYNVSLIDERGEIAAMYDGKPSLNVGDRTDVISFLDKATGMNWALRSLAPDVICTDEIGSVEDVEAIKKLCKCGVSFITTMHGSSIEDIKKGTLKEIVEEGYLDNVIILSNKNGIGSIDKIYTNLRCMEEVKC